MALFLGGDFRSYLHVLRAPKEKSVWASSPKSVICSLANAVPENRIKPADNLVLRGKYVIYCI